MKAGLLLLALGVSAPAVAAPAYLNCSITNADGSLSDIDVAADEGEQTATTTIKSTGYAERGPAVFSADTVSWNRETRWYSMRYALSRTDLTITRTTVIPNAKPSTASGICKISDTPKRAF